MYLHLRMMSSAIFSGSFRSSSVFNLKRRTWGVLILFGGSLVSKFTTMATSSVSASISPGWTLRLARSWCSSSTSLRRGIAAVPSCLGLFLVRVAVAPRMDAVVRTGCPALLSAALSQRAPRATKWQHRFAKRRKSSSGATRPASSLTAPEALATHCLEKRRRDPHAPSMAASDNSIDSACSHALHSLGCSVSVAVWGSGSNWSFHPLRAPPRKLSQSERKTPDY